MIKEILKLTDEQERYIEELPEYGTCIFKDRRFPRRYLLQIPSDLKIDPITQEETDALMKSFADEQLTRFRQAEEELKSIEVPEKDYTEKDLKKLKKIIYPETIIILQTLKDEPFLYRTPLKNRKEIKNANFDRSINWLLKNGFIQIQKCFSGKTRPAEFYSLTQKTHDLLETPKTKQKPSPKMFKHTYYIKRVAEYLETQNQKPRIEYRPLGVNEFYETHRDGKIIKFLQRIDVYAFQDGKHIAYEISMSIKTVVFNVFKCFLNFKMDEVHLVCEPSKMDQAKKALENSEFWKKFKHQYGSQVYYRDIREFL